MKKAKDVSTILWLSIPLATIIITASILALSDPGFYSKESLNWEVQSIGQDKVDLFFVTPVLLISAWLVYRGNNNAWYVWAGSVFYLLYTFVIYCTALHFNRLFLLYCGGLGFSFFSVAWFVFTRLRSATPEDVYSRFPARLFGIYFIIIALAFYGLWLAEIIPALQTGALPLSVQQTGLLTNTVQVLDLSVVLPGLFLTGILILRKKYQFYPLIPVWLSFFILMNCTIGVLALMMQQAGMEGNTGVAVIMGILTLISLLLLVLFFRRTALKTA